MLTKILDENKKIEMDINDCIYECIDENKSFIFNAGAGAGKTYSLVLALKYILTNKGKLLKYQKSKILCITYTNVATNEIKEEIANTSIIKVSTIHECMWDIIKKYQKQLVEIHYEKVINEIDRLNNNLKSDKEYEKYICLSEEQRATFIEKIFENKQFFYENYDKKANEFKNSFGTLMKDFPDILSNVANFKKIVTTLFKLDRLKKCKDGIDRKEDEYKNLYYDARYNNDLLHRMRISHDTLLEYANKLIDKSDLLKQIIIDKYPYIFVDEYQDTNEKVVKILNELLIYKAKIKHPICIGYFGDTVQTIYNDGIGEKIKLYTQNFVQINKLLNRRSVENVISVGNKIRNDRIKQKSIYDDCRDGTVEFYAGCNETKDNFIKKCVDEWMISITNPLHCFVLTNNAVAEYSGFLNIYNAFKETDLYKGKNYEQLNTELLSDDTKKLGEIQLILFNIIKMAVLLTKGNTKIENIVPKELMEELKLDELRDIIIKLKSISGNTLYQYIDSMIKIYNENIDGKCAIIIKKIFDMSQITMELFKNKLSTVLFPNSGDSDTIISSIETIINIEMSEYKCWYNYIIKDINSEIIYHTYHGTKGLEFNNVLIIMENNFGKSKDFFAKYFKKYDELSKLSVEELISSDNEDLIKARNLLYVSVTRAVKNLRIFYLDDIQGFETELKTIFGSINHFEISSK